MQGSPVRLMLYTDDLQGIVNIIRAAGAHLSDDDTVFHDQELEEMIPELVTALFYYPDPRKAMIQVFDTITRLLEDPDIHTAIEEMGK